MYASENLNVEVEVRDQETAVVTVGGELDLDTANLVHHHLANQMRHGRRYLVLDLSALDFMDSTGLNVLIRATRETRHVRGGLHLAAPTPVVRRLLDLTGVSTTSPIHAGVADALAAIASSSAAPRVQHTT